MGPKVFTEALYLHKASEVSSFTPSEGDKKGSIEIFLDEYKSREVNPALTYLSVDPTTIVKLARLHFVVRTASLVSLTFSRAKFPISGVSQIYS